jgi:hypothetical protein
VAASDFSVRSLQRPFLESSRAARRGVDMIGEVQRATPQRERIERVELKPSTVCIFFTIHADTAEHNID